MRRWRIPTAFNNNVKENMCVCVYTEQCELDKFTPIPGVFEAKDVLCQDFCKVKG